MIEHKQNLLVHLDEHIVAKLKQSSLLSSSSNIVFIQHRIAWTCCRFNENRQYHKKKITWYRTTPYPRLGIE